MESTGIRRLLRAGGLALAGLIVAPSLSGAAEDLKEVSISAVPSTSSVILYVAKDGGYFQNEGLDAEIVEFPSGAEAERAMVTGAVDLGGGGVGNSLIMANQDIAVKNIVLFQNRSIFTIVASNALEAEPGDLDALRGKKIGISSPGSLTDLFLRIVLSDAGIDPDKDVTLVATGGQSSHLPALDVGRVDAQITWEPATVTITKAEEAGKVFLDLRTDKTIPALENLLGSSLQATDEWLAEPGHREIAKAAARAVVKARADVVNDPQIMVDALKRVFPSLDESLLEEIASVEASSYVGSITPEAIEHMSKVYKSANIIEEEVSWDEVVDADIASEWQ